MPTQQNQTILQNAIDKWNQGDLDGYLQLYHPDIQLYGYQGVEPGISGVQHFYRSFWSAFPDSQIIPEDTIAVDDKVVCRFTVRATHGGTFMEIQATGKAVVIPGITILRFIDGKCVERWSQADFLGLMQQLA